GDDLNETTDPVAAQVRAIDAINPADLGFRDAVSGGVLAVNVKPGSGNPIGGQTVALKCWGRSVDEMAAAIRAQIGAGRKFQANLGRAGQNAGHRLGTAAVIRVAFTDAANYLGRIDVELQRAVDQRDFPERDLKLEALSEVLLGRSRYGSTATGPTTSPPQSP